MYVASDNHIQCCLPQESEPDIYKLAFNITQAMEAAAKDKQNLNLAPNCKLIQHVQDRSFYVPLVQMVWLLTNPNHLISTIGMNSVLDECIPWGSRIIIPPEGHDIIRKHLHATDLGVSRMKSLARCFIRYPNLDLKIERTV